MIIEITIKTDDNELIAKETAFNFESAGENLGKLERYCSRDLPSTEEIEEQFAEMHPDSKVSNAGENNEYEEIESHVEDHSK